jgi:hypothetical protein
MCCQRVHTRDWEFSDSRKVGLGVGSKVGGDSFLRQCSRDPVRLRGHRGFVLCELRRVIVLYWLLSQHCVAYQRRCISEVPMGFRNARQTLQVAGSGITVNLAIYLSGARNLVANVLHKPRAAIGVTDGNSEYISKFKFSTCDFLSNFSCTSISNKRVRHKFHVAI